MAVACARWLAVTVLLLVIAGCAGEQSVSAPVTTPLSLSPADRNAPPDTASQRAVGSSTPAPTSTNSSAAGTVPGSTPTAGAASHTVVHAPQLSTPAPAKRASHAVASPAPSPSPFLAVGACTGHRSSSGDAYVQLACSSPSALAVVTARLPVGAPDTDCPAGTDFALDVSTIRAVASSGTTATATGRRPTGSSATATHRGTVTTAVGIACLRNLRAPHPGDPGGGGGFGIVPGDCMYSTSRTSVQETACDGSDGHRPGYRILALVGRDQECPKATDAFISVHNPGAPAQVACALTL